MTKPINPGDQFGRLTVRTRAEGRGGRQAYWSCTCSCGTSKVVSSQALRTTTKSCGCLKREVDAQRRGTETHGYGKLEAGKQQPLYSVWAAMLQRCNNPKAISYPRYGGRGIKVCERWHAFANFVADVGERPSAKHSIDRIDPNGNYEPGNVRWATAAEQANTRRLSRARIESLLAKYEPEAPDVITRLRKELLG